MKYYNIHELIKLESTINFPRINYFKTPVPVKPDIRVITGKFNDLPESRDSLRLTNKYKLSRWKIQVEGFESPPIIIHFDGDRLFSHKLLFSAIVEPLIKYILSIKGGTMLHASSLSLNDCGMAFCGQSGTGKTTALLNTLKLPTSKYYSDDQTIVKDGVMYCYPTPIGVRTNTLINTPLTVNPVDLAGILGQNLLNVLTLYYGNLTWDLPLTRLRVGDKHIVTGTTTKLNRIYMMEVGEKDGVKKIEKDDVYPYLKELNMSVNQKQVILNKYFSRYREKTGIDLWKKTRKVLQKITDMCDYYLVTLQKPYKLQSLINEVQEVYP